MSAFKKIKLLIVEDNKSICDMYAIAFMKKGFVVYTAPDGRSALDKFEKKKPDIILLDIMMPHIDGFQVLSQIRKQVKYVPVIMLTNVEASHFSKEAQFGDVDEYLIKSNFTPAEVVDKTIEVLRLNGLPS